MRDRIENDPELCKEAPDPLPDEVTWTSGDCWEQKSKRITPGQKAKRPPKGQKGITRYGAKMIRNACHALQQNYGRKRLGFATMTLDSNPNWLLLCCWSWAEIVRKFTQEVKRELERVGAPCHIIGATEMHPKRSKDVGYIVPHLHFVYVSWDGKAKVNKGFGEDTKLMPDFYISHARMKEIFDRVCAKEIAKLTELPLSEIKVNNRVNLQAVRKSAEGYLGKYMSKGAKELEKYIEEIPGRDDIPSHWWHCTKELRQIVKSLVQAVPKPIIEAILAEVEDLVKSKVLKYLKQVTKEINGTIRIIGYAFRLNPEYNPISKEDINNAFNST